jgi:hypothetical protein
VERPIFDSVEEIIEEMIVMFGADIEDVIEGDLQNLSKTELEAVYDLMAIAYELGTEEV